MAFSTESFGIDPLFKPPVQGAGRGLHSSTFRLNVSAFCTIGGALRDCLWGG